MADQESNDVFSFSSMLFTDEQSLEPLIFFIRPSATRARLKQLIEGGGGIVTSRIDPSDGNVIRILADGDEHSTPDDHLPSYIDDCVAANTLLDKSEYKVKTKDQSTPVSEVTVDVSTKGRSYYNATEDDAILEYIAKHPYQYGGNKIWKKMEVMKITSHSWQSMRDRFLKKLEGRLHEYTKKRQQNLMMKRKRDAASDAEVQQSSGDDDAARETTTRKTRNTEEIEAESEASDTSSFDVDLFQTAGIKNTNAEGGNDEGIDNNITFSPRTTRRGNAFSPRTTQQGKTKSSSSEDQSKQEDSPVLNDLGLTSVRNDGTGESPTKSPTTRFHFTRSKGDGKQKHVEFESSKTIDAGKKQGKKSQTEIEESPAHLELKRKTRGKKTLEIKIKRIGRRRGARGQNFEEHNDIEMDKGAMQETEGLKNGALLTNGASDGTDDDALQETEGLDNGVVLTEGTDNGAIQETNGIDDDAMQETEGLDNGAMFTEGTDDDAMEETNGIDEGTMLTDGAEDGTIQENEDIQDGTIQENNGMDDGAMLLETEGTDDGDTETVTEDKVTPRKKESRRSSRSDSSGREMIVVRLSSSKKRKTPVKKPNKHLHNNKSPLRQSRRRMEIVSDSSGSEDGTSDVLPMKRTRHSSTPQKPASSDVQDIDHAPDTPTEEDTRIYTKHIEELGTKYSQTKLKILTALYVHSGDFARTEEYLQNSSKSKGPMWSSSKDKLLLTSPSRSKIRYSKEEVDQRLEWLKS